MNLKHSTVLAMCLLIASSLSVQVECGGGILDQDHKQDKKNAAEVATKDPCATVRCGYGANCEVVNESAKCVCPSICLAVYQPVCGSDGKTYGNECQLNAVKCNNKGSIRKVHEGACNS